MMNAVPTLGIPQSFSNSIIRIHVIKVTTNALFLFATCIYTTILLVLRLFSYRYDPFVFSRERANQPIAPSAANNSRTLTLAVT